MTSVLSHRSIAALKPLALVAALATVSFPVAAQVETGQRLSPVTVSQSRFESDSSMSPIGATVITAEQIREAGIGNVNEAIRKIGGAFGRQSAYGTSDYSLDLRGFGAASDQNIVVLVDGIRISENEQAVALMSSIAIESVERIEIVRGGSSVLYGEGATSGTIQIITKHGRKNTSSASLYGEVGSYGYQEMRASLAKGFEHFSINADLGSIHADNYRMNNQLRQDNFSGTMQWAIEGGRFGMRVEAARQDSSLPGGLSISQFKMAPRQTDNLGDYASIDSNRYTLFAEQRVGSWELAADVSYRDRNVQTEYVSSGFAKRTYDGKSTQFSPRARNISQFGWGGNEFIVGLDFVNASRSQTTAGSTLVNYGKQTSQAIYARNEIRVNDTRVAIGARHEEFDQTRMGSLTYGKKTSLNAVDLQASHALTSSTSIFAKIGRSYRMPNVDDNGLTPDAAPLAPQRSNDIEVGASIGNEQKKLTAKFFQHRLKNEIYYDPFSPPCFGTFCGANVNLDPTRREGVEIEASAVISDQINLKAVVQHVSAKFTDGPYAGNEIALVPKNTATVRLNWLPGNGHSADVGIQWVDTQRYANDFSNACSSKIPAYATLDARYSLRVGTWEMAVSGTNLTDKDYYTQAYGNCASDASVYPESGRSIRISLRKSF